MSAVGSAHLRSWTTSIALNCSAVEAQPAAERQPCWRGMRQQGVMGQGWLAGIRLCGLKGANLPWLQCPETAGYSLCPGEAPRGQRLVRHANPIHWSCPGHLLLRLCQHAPIWGSTPNGADNPGSLLLQHQDRAWLPPVRRRCRLLPVSAAGGAAPQPCTLFCSEDSAGWAMWQCRPSSSPALSVGLQAAGLLRRR